MSKKRCWKTNNPLYIKYHDEEWGVPIHDDNKLFEFLALGIFQAGLTWELILKKRNNFRKDFDFFNPLLVGKYDKKKIEELMNDSGIVRNRRKILATINNARSVVCIQSEYGSFDSYIWSFTSEKNLMNSYANTFSELPTKSTESVAMSKSLKKHGFKFVGPTICYAFMQAVGMVNDHLIGCFRREQVQKLKLV